MKKIIYFLSIIFIALSVNSCYDRDIIDYKNGVEIPTVSDLKSTLSASGNVQLNWNIPSNIPNEFERPVSIYIQVYRGTTLEYQISLANEPTSWNYILADSMSKYRVTVKMYGKLKEKTFGQSDEIYSLGQTVEIN